MGIEHHCLGKAIATSKHLLPFSVNGLRYFRLCFLSGTLATLAEKRLVRISITLVLKFFC